MVRSLRTSNHEDDSKHCDGDLTKEKVPDCNDAGDGDSMILVDGDGEANKRLPPTKNSIPCEELSAEEKVAAPVKKMPSAVGLERSEFSVGPSLEDITSQNLKESFVEDGEQTGASAKAMPKELQREPSSSPVDSDGISAKVVAERKRLPIQDALKKRFQTWKENRQTYAQEMPHTIEVFHQSCFYLGAFYCTHIWSTSNRIYEAITGGGSVFGLSAIHAFFDPFQGFLNFLVYQRPRYIRLRKQYPERSRRKILNSILRFSFMREDDFSNNPR